MIELVGDGSGSRPVSQSTGRKRKKSKKRSLKPASYIDNPSSSLMKSQLAPLISESKKKKLKIKKMEKGINLSNMKTMQPSPFEESPVNKKKLNKQLSSEWKSIKQSMGDQNDDMMKTKLTGYSM